MTNRQVLETSISLMQANLDRNDIDGAWAEANELAKIVEERKQDCSVCRRRHGRETVHFCE